MLTPGHILAINTRKDEQRAYSIYSQGFKKLDFDFDKDTEVYYSCSLKWRNQHYVFGGEKEQKQVSMVNGNRLELKGELGFDFDYGGCTVLNQQTIVLCFSDGEEDVCRQSKNPLGSFTELPNSNFEHTWIRIASFDGKNKSYCQ